LGADENLFNGKKTIICNPFNAKKSTPSKIRRFLEICYADEGV
jgi:hypothetical protein